jgi:hypothetical protein
MDCPTKTNMGQKWYQSTAYDIMVFLVYFKGPWPFKFKETFFSLVCRGHKIINKN